MTVEFERIGESAARTVVSPPKGWLQVPSKAFHPSGSWAQRAALHLALHESVELCECNLLCTRHVRLQREARRGTPVHAVLRGLVDVNGNDRALE